MLRELLEAIERADGALTVNELSRRTDLDPSVVEHMLELLVEHGRIEYTGRDCAVPGAVCRACPLAPGCGVPADRAKAVVESRRSAATAGDSASTQA